MNTMNTDLIEKYIKAKDENKPHLMKAVFSSSASLAMEVQSDNISFPSDVIGLNEITETLIRSFNNTYEDIYTICVSDTLKTEDQILKCRWLVGMTEKKTGIPRVGYGGYQWNFDPDNRNLVNHLRIVINRMFLLPCEHHAEVMAWFERLPYPWALSSDIETSIPNIDCLNDVRANLV